MFILQIVGVLFVLLIVVPVASAYIGAIIGMGVNAYRSMAPQKVYVVEKDEVDANEVS